MHQHDVIAMIGVTVENSLVYHVQKPDILRAISDCVDIPLILKEVSNQEQEETALEEAIQQSGAEAIVTGGLLSDFQRYYFNRIASRCGIPCFSPLWRKNQEFLVREMIVHRFEFIITTVSAMGLTRGMIGCNLDDQVLNKLISLSKQTGINIGGEGGEYETLVIDAPFFKKRLHIERADVTWDENACYGEYMIKEFKTIPKSEMS
jgi:uncharacterized protein (TIGR00290 family)